MGVAIKDLLPTKEIQLSELRGKVIAVDAMNMIYQFVTTIRQHDGTPLKDSRGNVTSHLTGLFARVMKLMEKGMKLVFVFDGEMPELKKEERKRREKLKAEALSEYKKAEEQNDVENMKKFASRSTRVSKEIIEESKELLVAMGIPVVQAPSEGEAQASYMVQKGDADYVASQDIDCMIYDAPRVVRNLSLSHKRKKVNALTYSTILPEVIELKDVLQSLDISLQQLRALAILVGTDFDVGGIKGLGPKKSLTLVKKFGEDLDALFTEVKFDETFPVGWKAVYETIEKMPVSDDYSLEWSSVDKEALVELLVEKHDFSKERVLDKIASLEKELKKSQQASLQSFFG